MERVAPHLPAAATLFEQLADAVYLLDPRTSNILWCNRAAYESLGLTAAQVLDHSVLSLQMDVTGSPQWADIAEVIRQVPCFTFVGRHRHAAGHEVAVEVNTTRFVENGREYFLSVARDTSRRLAMDGDLKQRENQLWFALNEATDGLWDWDTVTNEVFFSPQLKRMLGYGPDEMAPSLTTWTHNIHADDVATVMTQLQAHLEGRRNRYEAEYRLRNRNGNYLWVMDRGRVFERDANGHPTRVVGMVQDVTKERESQDALRRSEEAQRTLIAALPDIVMRLDRHGRYLFVSENVDTLAPMKAADMVGHTNAELGFCTALRLPWDKAISQVFSSGQAHEATFELASANGPRTFSWRVAPDGDHASGVRTVLVICRDVTEQRRAQAELQKHRDHLEELVTQRTAALSEAKATAEAANRAKSRFLAHMSHELRTPMNAIIGMTDLARRRSQDPQVQSPLLKVEQASSHLLSLISDILDLSKIEAERMVLEQAVFPLARVFDTLDVLAGQRASAKGVGFQVHMPAGLAEQCVIGDPLRLKQVVLNLVDNAVKFTDQGRVDVLVSAQPTMHADPGSDQAVLQIEVAVLDSGIGIAAEDHARLFAPFEQADNSTTRRYGGTGLGLTISRQLVEMMGGTMGVDSQPGQGSRFWFSLGLPLALPSLDKPTTPPAELARLNLLAAHAGRRVLVVEDDPVSQDVSVALLQRAGLVPDVASDGWEAVAKAAQTPYALVLMDMQMPHLSGLEATRLIRTQAGNAAVPILALTANAFEEDRQRCLEAGMNGHLTKPVQIGALYEKLLAVWAPLV